MSISELLEYELQVRRVGNGRKLFIEPMIWNK
jgi:hypothetical protein